MKRALYVYVKCESDHAVVIHILKFLHSTKRVNSFAFQFASLCGGFFVLQEYLHTDSYVVLKHL